ncbi:MAG TPA: hypothetical protein VFE27_08270 [Acidobacteriaceae bacterium]|nr:hypothetical protein [Acidobacteriaceae bacterium]
MTEDGKKPGGEAPGQPDSLSATGMFLNAFQTQPDEGVEQSQESAAGLFAPEDRTGTIPAPQWGQPFNAQPLRSSPAGLSPSEDKPAAPGEFTRMFQKLDIAASPQHPPQTSSAPQAGVPPEALRHEPGEFTRMFVAATASLKDRPSIIPDLAPFAPSATPRMKGFSTPGVSDSASADGSFTQLFRTPAASPAPPPRPFIPAASAPPSAVESAWPSSLDSAPSTDGMESAGATRLFRSLSVENEPAAQRFGEPSDSLFRGQSPQPPEPSAGAPGSITMLIQRLNEEQASAASSLPPPLAAGSEPAAFAGPGEFTRIISGGFANPAAGQASPAEKVAAPAAASPVFPAAVPLPPAPAFAPPPVPAVAVPKPPAPPPPPQVMASAPPAKSKFQQMLPMLLVLNAFLLVVLIVLLVFVLRSK